MTYSNYNLKKKITNFFYLIFHYLIIFYFLKKNFLKKNKIKFSKGFYEDIPFLLRLMLSNKKHIPFIRKKIYKKNFRKNSITSLLEKRHIEGYILAWFLCAKLLKKNFKEKEFVRNLIQVAFRGVLGYLILKLKKDKKTNYKNNIIFKNLIKKINPNFKNNLKYDQITRFFLENEKI